MLQNDWMRIRNNLFDDRAWFVRSAADLEYAAASYPPTPVQTPIPPSRTTTQEKRDGYLALTTAAGQEGWMKYELEGGALRLAFFDGLRGKPESFESVAGRSDPLLVVVRLVALQ